MSVTTRVEKVAANVVAKGLEAEKAGVDGTGIATVAVGVPTVIAGTAVSLVAAPVVGVVDTFSAKSPKVISTEAALAVSTGVGVVATVALGALDPTHISTLAPLAWGAAATGMTLVGTGIVNAGANALRARSPSFCSTSRRTPAPSALRRSFRCSSRFTILSRL